MTTSTEPGILQKLALSSWPFSEFEAAERDSLCPVSPPVCFLSCVTFHHFRDLHGYDYLVSVGVPPRVTPPASTVSAHVLMFLQIYVITLTGASELAWGWGTGGLPARHLSWSNQSSWELFKYQSSWPTLSSLSLGCLLSEHIALYIKQMSPEILSEMISKFT